MLTLQGKVRPTCFVQAQVDPGVQKVLEAHFLNEGLFRRAAYTQSWPEGAVKIPPALAPGVAALLKNDACPEITVRSLLAGQMQQAASVWEMMSFELIAKVAFDNLLELLATVRVLDQDVFYQGLAAELASVAAFETDLGAELPSAAA